MTLIPRDEVDSTNDCVLLLAGDGAPDWTVVQAGRQHSGRGSHGRAWQSPAGNLYLSVLLRTRKSGKPQLSLVSALAVADTVRDMVPAVPVTLKWPNDVLLAGCKVSGILLETSDEVVVIGVGINLAHAPRRTSYAATWIDHWRSGPVSIEEVRNRFLAALVRRVDTWTDHGFEPLRLAWLDRAHGLGDLVEVTENGTDRMSGRFSGLDREGCMLVTLPGGHARSIRSGTVRYLEEERA
ncbi:MAG: biotin--[acetyl-CoA-carboxylase] ligase [Alphaproteobacteria bacterium]|nr:biotin--[acetyl-CoA-carboxylase] ligase [Alphaproteobacteria bacterium]